MMETSGIPQKLTSGIVVRENLFLRAIQRNSEKTSIASTWRTKSSGADIGVMAAKNRASPRPPSSLRRFFLIREYA
jgi:hypothetical protein